MVFSEDKLLSREKIITLALNYPGTLNIRRRSCTILRERVFLISQLLQRGMQFYFYKIIKQL